jgi:hypothetical protein
MLGCRRAFIEAARRVCFSVLEPKHVNAACMHAGKGAYPNYVMDGVIDGFSEMNPKIGVSSIRNASQMKGLWTWSRGRCEWIVHEYLYGADVWMMGYVFVWRLAAMVLEGYEPCPLYVTDIDGCYRWWMVWALRPQPRALDRPPRTSDGYMVEPTWCYHRD